MSESTPGPWKIFDGYGADRSRPIIVDAIPDVDGKCVANAICFVATTNPDALANSELVARAPELESEVAAAKSRIIELEREVEKLKQNSCDVRTALLGVYCMSVKDQDGTWYYQMTTAGRDRLEQLIKANDASLVAKLKIQSPDR